MLYKLILFLPCFTSLFWVIVLLLNNPRKNTRPQNIWILFLLSLAICSFIWGILFNGIRDYTSYYVLDVMDITFSLTVLPLVHLFFRSITNRSRFTWKQYLCLLPGVVVGGVCLVLYLRMGTEQSAFFIKEVTENYESFRPLSGSLQEWLYLFCVYLYSVVVFLQIAVLMTYSSLNLIRYRKKLADYFSNLNGKSIENARAVLVGFFGLLFVGLIAVCTWSTSLKNYLLICHLLMAGIAACIYYMSFHVVRIRFTAKSITFQTEVQDIEALEMAEQKEVYAKIFPLFQRLIEEEKVFLQPNLSLDDIAQLMNSNRTYVSRIVNDRFGCNFHEFINGKRIEYAKTLLSQNPALSQEQAAEQSGFLYASTFSRVFKKHAGVSFSEWRRTFLLAYC